MEFDKSKVYTALNADELEIGDVVIAADTLYDIKQYVQKGKHVCEITSIESSDNTYRFEAIDTVYALAYLIAKRNDPYKEFKKAQAEGKEVWLKPAGLKWTDLKCGDVITNGNDIAMVTGIDTADDDRHIYAGYWWISDIGLAEWEKINA